MYFPCTFKFMVTAFTDFVSYILPPDHALTPSSSSGTSLSLANKQSQMDKLPQEKRDAIWSKAWSTWSAIGNKCVCKRLPSNDQIRTVLKSQKTEEIDQFFRVVPSQTFLVHLLQIFPHIYVQLRKTFSNAQFEVLSSILQVKVLEQSCDPL